MSYMFSASQPSPCKENSLAFARDGYLFALALLLHGVWLCMRRKLQHISAEAPTWYKRYGHQYQVLYPIQHLQQTYYRWVICTWAVMINLNFWRPWIENGEFETGLEIEHSTCDTLKLITWDANESVRGCPINFQGFAWSRLSKIWWSKSSLGGRPRTKALRSPAYTRRAMQTGAHCRTEHVR